MNERRDPLEDTIQHSLAHEIDVLIHELDGRIAPRFNAPATAKSWFFPAPQRVWKPALALGVLILSIGLGFYLGNRQNVWGPQTLQGADAALISESEEDAVVALYGASQQPEGAAIRLLVNQSKKTASETTGSAPQAMADAASESEASEVALSAIPAAPDDQAVGKTQTRMQFSFQVLLPSKVASIGLVERDPVFASRDDVVRMTGADGFKFLATALRNPSGVAVDHSGRVFITERLADGALIALEENGEKITIRAGLVYPAGIAFASDQSLYLAEQGRGRVLRFAPLDGTITPKSDVEVFATGFSGLLETNDMDEEISQGGPFALTVTQDNELLVSDLLDGKTAIYRFSLDRTRNWWDLFWLQLP